MSLDIFIGNDNSIEWQLLTNTVTGVVDTGAIVSVTLKDASGVNVPGQVWPATMTHSAGGTYRATLDAALSLTANRKYTAHLDVDGSGGEVGHKEIEAIAKVRTS